MIDRVFWTLAAVTFFAAGKAFSLLKVSKLENQQGQAFSKILVALLTQWRNSDNQ
jgi:hypothetical protein